MRCSKHLVFISMCATAIAAAAAAATTAAAAAAE
jgi:hypothetical protein